MVGADWHNWGKSCWLGWSGMSAGAANALVLVLSLSCAGAGAAGAGAGATGAGAGVGASAGTALVLAPSLYRAGAGTGMGARASAGVLVPTLVLQQSVQLLALTELVTSSSRLTLLESGWSAGMRCTARKRKRVEVLKDGDCVYEKSWREILYQLTVVHSGSGHSSNLPVACDTG